MTKSPFVGYVPSLDGMRALSIILVFIAHLGYDKIIPGGLGVTVFFFISGYLITNLLINEYNKFGKIDLKLFYSRRILRLYPPLLLALICYYIWTVLRGKPISSQELFASVFYYENYWYIYGVAALKYMKILWSLAVEEHFYVIFPLIFILFFKSPGKFVIMLCLLIIMALVFRLMYHGPEIEFYNYQLTHTRFDSIMFGCLSSVLAAYYPNIISKVLSNKVLFITALGMIVLSLVLRNEVFRWTLRFTLQGIALMIIVPGIVDTNAYVKLRELLSNKVLTFIGRISYSIYLFHMLWLGVMRDLTHKQPVIILGVTILTLTSSVATFYLVEKPMAKLRKKLQPVKQARSGPEGLEGTVAQH